MPYKHTMRSEVPNTEIPHFVFLAEIGPVIEFIQTLRRVYYDKILFSEDYHEGLVLQHTTVWESKAALDEFNTQLFEAFPTYRETREKYHTNNNIKWTVTLEETV